MNNKMAAILTTAITTGLLAAQAARAEDSAGQKQGNQAESGKNGCGGKDKNGCEGKEKNGCEGKDKNSCKGKDGKKKEKSEKNSCKNGCGESKDKAK